MNTSPNSNLLPAVDIALATFNGERYLPELLNSIEQQTYSRWNLIVGDDGSTDQTVKILNRFAATHPNQTILLQQTDALGTKNNFSRILQESRAGYAIPADQDDVWLPNKIERCLRHAQAIEQENPVGTPVLVHSDASVVDEALHLLDPSLWHHQNLCPKYGLKFKNLLVQNVITGCTALVNRPLLDLALPIPEASVMHDWWLGLSASAFGEIGYITEPTLLYRQHAGNQIGAKKWSPRHVADEAASGICALKKRIEATQQQALAFEMRFRDQLKKEEREMLNVYIRLSDGKPIRRQLLAARYRFKKCGLLRTAGFYAAL